MQVESTEKSHKKNRGIPYAIPDMQNAHVRPDSGRRFMIGGGQHPAVGRGRPSAATAASVRKESPAVRGAIMPVLPLFFFVVVHGADLKIVGDGGEGVAVVAGGRLLVCRGPKSPRQKKSKKIGNICNISGGFGDSQW